MTRARLGVPAAAWLVTALAILLAIAWSIAVPIYEAPDEPHHWQVARYIHSHRSLPLYGPTMVEGNQPPTYYALIAPLARTDSRPSAAAWIDGEDRLFLPFPPRLHLNESDWWQHYGWIRLARILTAIVSAMGIVFVYLAGAEATGSRALGLLAAGLAAFLPQFSFRAGTISNDTLLVPFSAAATWLTVRLVCRGFAWAAAIGAAAAAAAAYLTKINTVCLVPPLVLAVVIAGGSWRERSWRAIVIAATFGALVLPWSVSNVLRYGDVFASGAMLSAVASIVDVKPVTSPYFRTTFPNVLFRSLVGSFGWLNVGLPERMYAAYALLGVAAAVAVSVGLFRRRIGRRVTAVLLTTVIGSIAVVVHINLTFSQPQGRYLFPALPALATLVALGGLALPPGARRMVSAGMLAVALTANLYALCTTALAYYPPVVTTVHPTVIDVATPGGGPGLERGPDGTLRITADDPQLAIPVHVAAADVNFLQFELEGAATDAVVLGSVYFARSDSAFSEQQRVDFRWKPDGRRRLITVALSGRPEWRGVVTGLRIDPLNARTAENRAAHLRIGRVRLKGRL